MPGSMFNKCQKPTRAESDRDENFRNWLYKSLEKDSWQAVGAQESYMRD